MDVERTKPLRDLTAGDIPRGLSPYDVASDFGPEPGSEAFDRGSTVTAAMLSPQQPVDPKSGKCTKPKPATDEPPLEKVTQNLIRLDLGMEPDLVLYRNSTGMASHESKGKTYKQRFGLCVGSSDLIGILSPGGRWFCLEIKRSEKEKPTDEQVAFMRLVRNMGGFACVVWSVETARAALARARKGERE